MYESSAARDKSNIFVVIRWHAEILPPKIVHGYLARIPEIFIQISQQKISRIKQIRQIPFWHGHNLKRFQIRLQGILNECLEISETFYLNNSE